MNEDLKQQTRDRIAEIEDLANRLRENPGASNFERSTWLNGIKDRCTLLRNVLGVALGDGGKPVSEVRGPSGSLEFDPAQWDRPDAEVIAALGVGLVEVWAVKNMMANGGYPLRHPAPPESRAHWRKVAEGG